MKTTILIDAKAEALFVSDLQPSQQPSTAAVESAISRSIRTFGSRGCAARVAQEYGEHPEIAVARMRWARTCVACTASPAAQHLPTAA
ncbi:MAG: hypothetical protein ACRDT4_21740 [Micromonosporaceae bacterium]